MVKVIRFHKPGGPEVLTWEDVETPPLSPNEIRIRHTVIGLNFIDTYHRSGLYPLPLPSGLGMEAAGIVEALGHNVTDLAVGDRVAYASPPPGAYSEERVIDANNVVSIPSQISDDTAAAVMLKGLTAQYLLRQIHKVGPSDTILIHAAAGGVGLLVCQWAKSLGATVIGTVGNEEKAGLAKANGCDFPIIYTRDDFLDRVLEITSGEKVPVVFDSIGKDTFEKSLDCLKPLGKMVSFGQASGPIPPVDLGVFAQKGSLTFTRPTLFHYANSKESLAAMAEDLFKVIVSNQVTVRIDQRFPLKEARAAHEALEARSTTASTILIP
ncbi:MAG: quinone oxidoreductase [Rhodospirillaceae bacterium]|nr:quinone oxidoreductase [Rhodospirillaceae bacterium]|tara:strand:- start:507 stop:1481 length:975 start_codon:yes stop_codon:yes gene_type:complete